MKPFRTAAGIIRTSLVWSCMLRKTDDEQTADNDMEYMYSLERFCCSTLRLYRVRSLGFEIRFSYPPHIHPSSGKQLHTGRHPPAES